MNVRAPLVVRWNSDYGNMSAIIFDVGSKYVHILPMESRPLRTRKIPIDSHRLTPLTYKGKPYPIARVKKIFKRHAETFGMTVSAKKVLTSI